MSAGMAGVIADVLSKHRKYVRNEDVGGVICDECGWEVASKLPTAESTTVRMSQHESQVVARELTKAGYGNMREAWDEGRKHGATWPYGKKGLAVDENPYRADPLTAALADSEGHALVQAIHDRKAEA